MLDKKIKISYQKQYGNNGTVYTQKITIPKELAFYINSKIQNEKMCCFRNDNLYKKMGIYDFNKLDLYLDYIDFDKINYLSITQLRFIKYYLILNVEDTLKYVRKVKSDRNTILEVLA